MDHFDEPIDVYVPNSPDDDPRDTPEDPPGLIIHRGPPLHPDDLAVVDGIPCTSVARTLVDLAGVVDGNELRQVFFNAEARGLLDLDEVCASAERAEWRPSLPLLYEVVEEFRAREGS